MYRSISIIKKNTQKPSFEMKASHAGLTKEEIKVPLIVFEKRKDDF